MDPIKADGSKRWCGFTRYTRARLAWSRVTNEVQTWRPPSRAIETGLAVPNRAAELRMRALEGVRWSLGA